MGPFPGQGLRWTMADCARSLFAAQDRATYTSAGHGGHACGPLQYEKPAGRAGLALRVGRASRPVRPASSR